MFYSREDKLVGTPIQNDPALDIANDSRLPEQHHASTLIDFVIAEVKSGRPELNEIWNQPDHEGSKAAKIEYLLRWMGPIASDEVLQQTAISLQKEHWAIAKQYSFRIIRFVSAGTAQAEEHSSTPSILFSDIARWIVTCRTACWRECGLGARSAHDQWDPMIKAIWECGNPRRQVSQEDRVAQILRLLAGA